MHARTSLTCSTTVGADTASALQHTTRARVRCPARRAAAEPRVLILMVCIDAAGAVAAALEVKGRAEICRFQCKR
jgi:hypothetical protein